MDFFSEIAGMIAQAHHLGELEAACDPSYPGALVDWQRRYRAYSEALVRLVERCGDLTEVGREYGLLKGPNDE